MARAASLVAIVDRFGSRVRSLSLIALLVDDDRRRSVGLSLHLHDVMASLPGLDLSGSLMLPAGPRIDFDEIVAHQDAL